MRRYALCTNASGAQSATLPLFTVMGAATVRVRIYDMIFSSDATPADQAVTYRVERVTSAGTPGTSPTANPLDPADPAAIATCGLAVFTGAPTTAHLAVLQFAHNQRATFRWVAAPDGELVIPATAANGLMWLPTVATASFNESFTTQWQE